MGGAAGPRADLQSKMVGSRSGVLQIVKFDRVLAVGRGGESQPCVSTQDGGRQRPLQMLIRTVVNVKDWPKLTAKSLALDLQQNGLSFCGGERRSKFRAAGDDAVQRHRQRWYFRPERHVPEFVGSHNRR